MKPERDPYRDAMEARREASLIARELDRAATPKPKVEVTKPKRRFLGR